MDCAGASVLVVDDDPIVLESNSEILRISGFSPTPAEGGEIAMELCRKNEYEVAIVDLCMPGISGLETIQQIKQLRPDMEIIILTGHPTLESSLAAIDEHIFSYLCKPQSMDVLLRVVRYAVGRYRLVRQNRDLLRQLKIARSRLEKQVESDRKAFERQVAASPAFIGKSEPVERVRRQIAEVAPSDMTVLVRGESGTGKDVVARLISELSGRTNTGGFVKINCPAIPETLLESELFGHEAGAFTGAERRKPGRFEIASEGTVFLDEIAEIPVTLQAKLLQVIEYKQFCRLGSTKTINVNARIVAATNAPLESMIAAGQFRSDLFYRLNEYSIHMPSLRERPEDIPLLVEHFLRKHGATVRHPDPSLSGRTLGMLMEYTWPGNIRELESVVRRYALTGSEETIHNSLSQPMIQPSTRTTQVLNASLQPDEDSTHVLSRVIHANEAQAITEALVQTDWNRRKAAKLLGTSYSTLRRKIATYDIKRPAGHPAFGSR